MRLKAVGSGTQAALDAGEAVEAIGGLGGVCCAEGAEQVAEAGGSIFSTVAEWVFGSDDDDDNEDGDEDPDDADDVWYNPLDWID